MPVPNRIQRGLIQTEFYAPRGRARIFDLGMQIAQLYLSPFDKLIGFVLKKCVERFFNTIFYQFLQFPLYGCLV